MRKQRRYPLRENTNNESLIIDSSKTLSEASKNNIEYC